MNMYRDKLANLGFTLIEIMVTIAIAATLAVVAVPSYQNRVIKSKVIKALVPVGGIADAMIEAYYLGTWNCNTTTTFDYNNFTYTVDLGTFESAGPYADLLGGIQILGTYGPYICSDKWLGAVYVIIKDVPTDLLFVCVLGKDDNGIVGKKCGIWENDSLWVSPKYIPKSLNCILELDTTIDGKPCAPPAN